MIPGVANADVPPVNNQETWLQKAFYNNLSTPTCSIISALNKLSRVLHDVMTLHNEKDGAF